MPMPLATRLRSTGLRVMSSPSTQRLLRWRARLKRTLSGIAPVVQYFHQVDDPHSHLAVQMLDRLRRTYGIGFAPYLVKPPEPAFKGDAQRFESWAHTDACSVAAFFNTTMPDNSLTPDPAQVQRANAALAGHLLSPDFAALAYELGEQLWSGNNISAASSGSAEAALREGTELRERLGHYFGASFHYDGEWYWGVDRLHHLERRLQAQAYAAPSSKLCVPLPEPTLGPLAANTNITLEYFPSLSSPYTAVGHQRVVDLVEQTGVALQLRPVMPMLMRGIPAPAAKQRYIAFDAAREARFYKVGYGSMVDPFGEPVKRAFALYPTALRMNRGLEFISSYLAAAWAKGIDISSEQGLAWVVEDAGLAWPEVQRAAQGDHWEAVLEENVGIMLEAGLWGVPSFRVSGGNHSKPFCCWGQDRIWRVAAELMRRNEQQSAGVPGRPAP